MIRKSTSLIFSAVAMSLVLTVMLSAGCAIQPAPALPLPAETRIIIEPAPKLISEQLLNYLLEARALSTSDLMAEKERVRADFSRSKTEFNRMKLAILIAIPSAAAQSSAASSAEDAELNTLLDPVTYGLAASGNAAAPDLRALATLMQGLVQDRKKLRDQLRESLSRTQITRRDEASSLSEARILRAKVDELEKKLDALKSIERSVSVKSDARNNATPPPRTDGAPK